MVKLNNSEFSFESSDNNIASVDETGTITAVHCGIAKI